MKLIKAIQTRRGAQLKLNGAAEKALSTAPPSSTFALNPDDFFGLTPKLSVKEGDTVKKGSPLFFDKKNPEIIVVSPIAGSVEQIHRGPKRKIESIIIKASSNQGVIKWTIDEEKRDSNYLKKMLLQGGLWPFIQQRPYGIIANPDDTPKAIFVSTFPTSPLAIDYDFTLQYDQEDFQNGIDILNNLVDTPINLGVSKSSPGFFEKIQHVNHYSISGPHPAGNVSLHIQEISPINSGDRIWTVNPEDVVNIGRFFKTGEFSGQRTIAVCGNGIRQPKYFVTSLGVELAPLLENVGLVHENVRIINGDILTGNKVSVKGHLGYFNTLVTVIPEGNHYRMLGWLPFKDNGILSLSNTSFSRLFGRKGFDVDTNLNGEERAMVVTGEMEKVFPFDIYPMQLLKACLVENIEKMEALGIYEVVPEDFGLIDYANTSKIESQEIIRKGIELMIKEVG
jgi:Na+-transporting NADH:ubiquinone oxidoreductase subunit A